MGTECVELLGGRLEVEMRNGTVLELWVRTSWDAIVDWADGSERSEAFDTCMGHSGRSFDDNERFVQGSVVRDACCGRGGCVDGDVYDDWCEEFERCKCLGGLRE